MQTQTSSRAWLSLRSRPPQHQGQAVIDSAPSPRQRRSNGLFPERSKWLGLARKLAGLAVLAALVKLSAVYRILQAVPLSTHLGIHAGPSAISPTANGYVLCGDTLAFETNQAWTITASINSSQLPGEDGASVILCKIGSGPAYRGYELWIDSDGHLIGECISDNARDDRIAVVGSTTVTDGCWHSVALTCDGTESASGLKLYVDGAEDPSTVWADHLTGTIASTAFLTVGTQLTWSAGEYFRGTIAQVTISDIARSPDYLATYGRPENPPPVDSRMQLCYRFNEGFGASTEDASGHGRTGTLTSNIWASGLHRSGLAQD